MLPKKNRLKAKKDFSRVFSKGKVVSEKVVMMKHVANGLGYPRVGFVVSSKVSKKAVHRNRLKRRMRDVIRKIIEEMKGESDIVFIVRPDALKLTFGELQQAMESLLRKTKMIS